MDPWKLLFYYKKLFTTVTHNSFLIKYEFEIIWINDIARRNDRKMCLSSLRRHFKKYRNVRLLNTLTPSVDYF